MYTLWSVVVIVLAGQVGGAVGDRYGRSSARGFASDGQAELAPGLPSAEATTTNNAQPLSNGFSQQPAGRPATSAPGNAVPDYRRQSQPAVENTTPQGNNFSAVDSGSTAAATDNTVQTLRPVELFRTLRTPPARGQLRGTPVGLAEVVQGARSRNEQTQRVEAYWDLSAAVTQYRLALRELTTHQALAASLSQAGVPWQQTQQLLKQQALIARDSAKAAQFRLQRLRGQSMTGSLPLPADMPHCGNYDSRYDDIFGSQPSPEAEQLNDLLAHRFQALKDLTNSVAAAHQWLNMVSERRSPQSDGSDLLKAHELLRWRRRAFIDAVHDYNQTIAQYTELATPGRIGTQRLVAMLIHTPIKLKTPDDRGVRRTSAEESVGSPSGSGSTRRTFADERTNAAIQMQPPQHGVEHSILTQPKR